MNNTYNDSYNDSMCNRIRSAVSELKQRTLCTDFTCKFEVHHYNEAVERIKILSSQLHKVDLEFEE